MFGTLQHLIVFALSVAAFAGALWGLIDAIKYPDSTFQAAGKLNKTLWLLILGAASVVAFLALPWPLGTGGGIGGIMGIAAIVAVIVYFVDVRPKLQQFGGRNIGGHGNRSQGGW
ncbi:DUF2516 family protein [Demequina sp. B12]|uniref:DUF2516 family protein n=1 Tax=Demequina sp. B12 TaxID=2992757 RepID=UPI00237A4CE4|nr:DUF2516 family protein [Demequina sp. B12]MDE0572251.1 DUF2516 family protein [Demequina sp. B12]